MLITVMTFLAGATIVGTFTWIFNINSKVHVEAAVSDQRYVDLKELINSKFNSTDQRLERIERAMNGSLKGSHV